MDGVKEQTEWTTRLDGKLYVGLGNRWKYVMKLNNCYILFNQGKYLGKIQFDVEVQVELDGTLMEEAAVTVHGP